MIEGGHSIEDDLKATNPNYVAGRDGVWENNCQRCVVAYELRRRGIDVQAKPCNNDPLEEDKVRNQWKKLNGDAKWERGQFPNGEKRQTFIENKMKKWGEGSRATVYVDWEDGTAHVFSAEMVNGKVVFVDPQTGEYNPTGNFPDQKVGTIKVARVDNLKINDYIIDAVEVKK